MFSEQTTQQTVTRAAHLPAAAAVLAAPSAPRTATAPEFRVPEWIVEACETAGGRSLQDYIAGVQRAFDAAEKSCP